MTQILGSFCGPKVEPTRVAPTVGAGLVGLTFWTAKWDHIVGHFCVWVHIVYKVHLTTVLLCIRYR